MVAETDSARFLVAGNKPFVSKSSTVRSELAEEDLQLRGFQAETRQDLLQRDGLDPARVQRVQRCVFSGEAATTMTSERKQASGKIFRKLHEC